MSNELHGTVSAFIDFDGPASLGVRPDEAGETAVFRFTTRTGDALEINVEYGDLDHLAELVEQAKQFPEDDTPEPPRTAVEIWDRLDTIDRLLATITQQLDDLSTTVAALPQQAHDQPPSQPGPPTGP